MLPNHEHDRFDSIIIESDKVTLINKLILRINIKVLMFNKISFFKIVSSFSPHWKYKNRDKEYYSEKVTNSSSIDKIHLKSDCIEGAVLNGVRQPKLYSSVLDTPPGYKMLCELETIHFEKLNKSVFNILTFYNFQKKSF